MRRLFWKEWRENWLVVVCTPLLLALFMVGYKLNAGSNLNSIPDPAWLIGLCAVAAIIIGAGLFAREIGNETLGFLLSQPVSRRRVWAIKCAAGLIMLLITALAAVLVWSILYPRLFTPLEPYQQRELNDWGPNLLDIIACFIVSLGVSTLMDRSLAAVGVALAVCAGLCIPFALLCTAAENLSGRSDNLCSGIIMALSLPAFIAVSYRTFTRGESLRTPRRFMLAGTACAIGLAIAWTPPFAAYLYLSHFNPVGNAVTTPSVSPDGRWVAIQVLNRRIPPSRDSSQPKPDINSSYVANHLVIERPDGSGPRYILPGGQPLAWSVDGRYLIYWQFRGLLSMDRGYHTVLVETATGRLHSIDGGESSAGALEGSGGGVAFSPNGRWLAMTVHYPTDAIFFYDLRQLAAGAGKLMPYSGIEYSNDWRDTPERIFQPAGYNRAPNDCLAWSSDSRFLFYEGLSGVSGMTDGDNSALDPVTPLLKAVDTSRLMRVTDSNNYRGRRGQWAGDYTLCSLSGTWPFVNMSQDRRRALMSLVFHTSPAKVGPGKSMERAIRTKDYVIDLTAAAQAAEDSDPEQDPPTVEKWIARWGHPIAPAANNPLSNAQISPDGGCLMIQEGRHGPLTLYETAHPDLAPRRLPVKIPSGKIWWRPEGHSFYVRQSDGRWALVDAATGALRQLPQTGLNPIGIGTQGHLLFCDKVMRNVFRPGVKRTEDGYAARSQGARRAVRMAVRQ